MTNTTISTVTYDNSKHSSEFLKIPYITTIINCVPKYNIDNLSENINRASAITEIIAIVFDFDIAAKIEAGIFEYTLIYGLNNNVILKLLPAVYQDKLFNIIDNIKNKKFVEKLTKSDDACYLQKLAFMRPCEICPEKWETIIRKNKLREEKRNNVATTDLYMCNKCKERRCTVMEMQTRSGDEAVTRFITCLNCNITFKK